MGRAYVSNILPGRVREELMSWAGTRGVTRGTGGGEVSYGNGEAGDGEALGSGGQVRAAAVRLTPFPGSASARRHPVSPTPCPRRILTEMPIWPSLRGGIISAILFRGLIRILKPKQDPK